MSTWSFEGWGVATPGYIGRTAITNDTFNYGDMPSYVGSQLPVGAIYIATSDDDPAKTLGYGTWEAFGPGRILIGVDPSDADYDTAEETSGSKTHKHTVDVANTTSGSPSAVTSVDNNADGSTVNVGSESHTHDVNPASVDTSEDSNMPPVIAVHMWKRTA